ncbi:bifunctional glutamate N-acetyltransferase/amino-acid acetyltransferase ArgJ [Bacillota bacterium LX-D]|nr:bifunctional glutamate N-acetyltransferase/amino-acid acetyltransferase ArgJ [Bacillota bacterium LX-D]
MQEYTQVPGGVAAVNGFMAAGIHAGLKKANKDLALIFCSVPAVAAGVFTTNQIKAAPLLVNQKHLQNLSTKAIIINSGNANACNGEKGLQDAEKMAVLTAQTLGCAKEEVLVASTGVIGDPMPMDKIEEGIKKIGSALSVRGGKAAAEAILTTDTFAKEAGFQFSIGDRKVTIGGMAKGSGMIHPNMATMLSFITTDAAIEKKLLQETLGEIVKKTFNMITVDGDTSTNDMVLVLANGLAENTVLKTKKDPGYQDFYEALNYICMDLAQKIARDGEGATKFVTVEVCHAQSEADACLAARAVCSSNLVKTALFGEDANWGRVIAAVGYSGAKFDPDKVDILIKSAAGEEQMAQDGVGLMFDEAKAKEILTEKDITIVVDFKQGENKATAWGCDFSYDYVKINSSYRS